MHLVMEKGPKRFQSSFLEGRTVRIFVESNQTLSPTLNLTGLCLASWYRAWWFCTDIIFSTRSSCTECSESAKVLAAGAETGFPRLTVNSAL